MKKLAVGIDIEIQNKMADLKKYFYIIANIHLFKTELSL